MFDNQPQDLLQDVEPSPAKPTVRTPGNNASFFSAVPTPSLQEVPRSGGNGVWWLGGIVAGIVLVAGAAFAVWNIMKPVSPISTPPSPPASEERTVPIPDAGSEIIPVEVTPIDTDTDGLSDAEEQKHGTDVQRTDSDNDELSDFEEVDIWHTDPLNADSDGDRYKDGEEVKNGYNPKGPGRLLPVDVSSPK